MADERYSHGASPRAARVAWREAGYDERSSPESELRVRLAVVQVAARLEESYGSADLGNLADPISELVWIPLTRQTHRQNSQRCWRRIVELGGPAALLDLSEDELVVLIKDGGLSRQKARWIKRSLEMIVERFGRLSLDDGCSWSDSELEAFLRTLPGIAVKSAKCVMMYSMGRQVLPVDTHLRRLAERLGWVGPGLTEKRIHETLEALVPPEFRYGLHVNAVWHGRSTCRALRPACAECVLLEWCPEGLGRAASGNR